MGTRLLLWVLLQAHHFSYVFLHSISRPLLVYFSLSTLLFLISQRKSHSSSKFFFASCIYDNPAHIFLCAVCFCFPDFFHFLCLRAIVMINRDSDIPSVIPSDIPSDAPSDVPSDIPGVGTIQLQCIACSKQ